MSVSGRHPGQYRGRRCRRDRDGHLGQDDQLNLIILIAAPRPAPGSLRWLGVMQQDRARGRGYNHNGGWTDFLWTEALLWEK